MDPGTFEGVVLTTRFERCLSCGYASRYERRDYYFVSDAGARGRITPDL